MQAARQLQCGRGTRVARQLQQHGLCCVVRVPKQQQRAQQPRLQAQRTVAGRARVVLCRADAAAAAAPTPNIGKPLGPAYSEDGNMPDWHKGRRAGVILHPTSLPGPYGIGELGQEAFRFIDWLQDAGMQCWQVLPLVPPDPEYYSPYSGLDTNCGNPLLIDLEALITEGLLQEADRPPLMPDGDVQFAAVAAAKQPLLQKAARTLLTSPKFAALRQLMAQFRAANSWIEDSALFDALRQTDDLAGKDWWEWPDPLRFRKASALKEAHKQYQQQVDEFVAVQFLFDRQWRAVKVYANAKGIKIIGDMPIYVGGQSADVWANRHLFELNEESCAPDNVSGVPPDAFSATGQLWGSPLYRWEAHEAEGYKWWAHRMARALQLYDETRIDHFRAFAGYWSIVATEETAMNGSWCVGPGIGLFQALTAQLGAVPILAEDLGVITTDVVQLREQIGAPGMVVLQFAWGGGTNNVHLPHMHYENSFCYPGTHDNETAVGWLAGSANAQDKKYLKAYLGSDGKDIAWDFIRAAMASVSNTSIIMMQDIMRLDNSARMNTPGKAAGNWAWRVGGPDVWEKLAEETKQLKQLAYVYDRMPKGTKEIDY
uniref:4-alpha-glucanotransferase n=1 Tax=Tetradesmus obliquus TaxID=3088 RepID=A0A383V4Y2_TETOB|eukprot:jgi/Sobl393_1/11754/SZX59779.1